MRTPTERSVPATDANRRFSELLREVQRGQSILVTSHGKPVAKIIPVTGSDRTAEEARSSLLSRLRKQRPVSVGRWSRDELYDDLT